MKLSENEVIGKKYGHLTILKVDHYKYRYYPNGKIRGRRIFYLCQCDCGNQKVVNRDYLLHSPCPSCGCVAKHNQNMARITHNLSSTRIYNIYYKMLDRCNNPKCKQYPNYGGRGISICQEWNKDFISFYNWAMNNGYKDNLTIDRINNNGNYEPSNCRWVDRKIQNNNRRNNFLVTIYNRTQTLAEWCDERNLKYQTVCCRLARGWSLEKSLTTPTA